MPEQTSEPRYPPSSALSNTSNALSTVSDSLLKHEQDIWPTPSIDSIGLENHDLNVYPETTPYPFLDFDSQCLSYDSSYDPSGYTNTSTTITYPHYQPLDGQILGLDSTFDFFPEYSEIGLDQMHNWHNGFDYGSSIYSSPVPDSENPFMWINDPTIQDLDCLGNQSEDPFSTQVDSLSSSQVQH